MVEIAFKAFARALRQAVAIDPRPAGRAVDQGRAVTRIAILDYGMGNLRSVSKALEHVGAEAELTRDHARVRAADGIVLPGVGAMPRAMEHVRRLELDELLRERVAAGVPLIGVCMGMQLLFESTVEHGGAEGIGLLAGGVERLAGRGPEGAADRLEPRLVAA